MLCLRMRVTFTVLLCHGSTEEDQAKEADQSSDGFTINDVVDINDRHYFNIFFPWTQGIKPYFHFLPQQIRYIFGYNVSRRTLFKPVCN